MVQCNPWENPVYFDGCCTHTEKIKFLLWHRVFVYTMEEVRMILYYGLHPDVRRDPKKLLNISYALFQKFLFYNVTISQILILLQVGFNWG